MPSKGAPTRAPERAPVGVMAHAVGPFVFASTFALAELVVLGRDAWSDGPRHTLAVIASVTFGLAVAPYRRFFAVRAGLGLAIAFVVACEAAVARVYHAFVSGPILESAWFAWGDVRSSIVTTLPWIAVVTLALAIFVVALPVGRAPGRRARILTGTVFAFAIVVGPRLRDATPELRLVSAFRDASAGVRASRARSSSRPAGRVTVRRFDPEVPIVSAKARLPNVLLLVTESVRADAYCRETDDCLTGRATRVATGPRTDFHAARSVASYTAVSIAAILTGVAPVVLDSEALRHPDPSRAPNVFDVLATVRTAGGGRVTTAYWSSQLGSVFESEATHEAVGSMATLETLVGHPVADEDELVPLGVDRLLETYAKANFPRLLGRGPAFVIVHLAGTHAPYFVDDTHAPFRPYSNVVRWSGLDELSNAYKNALVEQDLRVAGIVQAFREANGDAPHAILFTSDHGEAFGEHRGIHHGQNLFDEQLRVPTFVVVGGGAVDETARRNLATHAILPTTHLDVAPSIYDLYGVLDAAPVAKALAVAGGASWFRAVRGGTSPVPISNCTTLFHCPVATWGMLDGATKLHGQVWDAGFTCYDADERGERPADPESPPCRRLFETSKVHFPTLPNGRPNR
ncbi:MAG: sulfatase-like hydrolase/transferase [Polyangiaceae bacterium]